MNECLLCQAVTKEQLSFKRIFCFEKIRQEVCPTCLEGFQVISLEDDCCKSCGKKNSKTTCLDCQHWQKQGAIVDHHSLYQYNQAMQDYFKAYKFQGDYLLRKVFSHQIKNFLNSYKGYTIIPIPISEERMEERGFNQVEGWLEDAGIPYSNILKKNHSVRQSSLSRSERLQMRQSFYVEETIVPNKILLVDDIYTTGASMHLAKQALMKKGAKTIKTFSLAR